MHMVSLQLNHLMLGVFVVENGSFTWMEKADLHQQVYSRTNHHYY